MMTRNPLKLALVAMAWAAFAVAGTADSALAEDPEHDHSSHEGHGDAKAEKSADAPTSRPAAAGELMNAKCPYTGKDSMADKYISYSDEKKGIYARVYVCCPNCLKNGETLSTAEKKELYEKVFLTKKDGKKLKYGKARLIVENKTCPVSADPVDGEHFVTYNGAQVALCCAGCEEGFASDPDKFLHNINNDVDAAVAKAKAVEAKS